VHVANSTQQHRGRLAPSLLPLVFSDRSQAVGAPPQAGPGRSGRRAQYIRLFRWTGILWLVTMLVVVVISVVLP
jgi:hypothetical protein